MTFETEHLIGGDVASSFSHEGFLYSDDEMFLEVVVPFISEGVDGGELVKVGVDQRKIGLLKRHFQSEPNVEFVDMFDRGRNPSRIIGAWDDFVERGTAAGRPVRGVGELVWPGRSEAELEECLNYEALINVAFTGSPSWRLLCPYQVSALPSELIDQVEACHPFMNSAGDGVCHSPRYRMPEFDEVLSRSPLPEPTDHVVEVEVDRHDLRHFRMVVSTFAIAAGLRERVDDFVLAANEVATNSVRHGGTNGTARVWNTERGIVCDISNEGRIADPLVGRTRPPHDAESGRGLWLANLLCDLVQVRSNEAGTVVRLHMFDPTG